jgi:HK97 family phage major capsid protein
MSDITKTLHEQYRNDWEEAKSLLARAADEKRELSAEEEVRWTSLNDSMTARKAKMDQVAAAEERSEKIGALAERALKVENAVKADNDGDVLRAIATGEKRRAQFEIRALASATATVPVTFADFVVVALTEGNPIYDGATKLRTTTGEQITLPRVTANQTAAFVTEGSTINAADPTISSITLYANKIASLTLLSAELVRDAGFDILGTVGRQAGAQIAFIAGSAMAIGTGTAQPQGFVSVAGNAQLSTATKAGTVAATFFDALDLATVLYSLSPSYRNPNTVWHAATSAVSKLRKLQDLNGQFVFQPSMAAGQPDTLMGYRLKENVHMAAVASASKSVAIVHEPSYYVRELPIEVASSTDYLFNTNQVAIRTLYGVDGNLPDVTAVRVLVSANT